MGLRFLHTASVSEEKLEEYYGKNIKSIKEELREQAREQSLVQQVQQKLIGDQKITPSEVRKAFMKVSPEDIPQIPAKVEVQIITVEPTIGVPEVEAIKTKLRGFKERIESGVKTLRISSKKRTPKTSAGGRYQFRTEL